MTTSDKKTADESWESFAERRIREAESEGAFANLPGFGQPIPGIGDPLDENWWVKQKLARERVNALPPILEARLDVERTLERLRELTDEATVRRELLALNERCQRAQFSHVPGPSDGVRLVDVDAAVERWRAGRPNAGGVESSGSIPT